jgi:hypothetical protein
MDIDKFRQNLPVQIGSALILGVALDFMTGYARHFTAPLFVYFGKTMIAPNITMGTTGTIIINSSHAFFAGLMASFIGLAILHFSFRIYTMFLPLLSCASFAITTNWWFFSNIQEIFRYPGSLRVLVALFGHLSAVLAWLLLSWFLVKWVLPNKRMQSDANKAGAADA